MLLIADDDNDQPPEGEEEKEPVAYYVSNEVHYSNSKMSSLVCIKRNPVIEADKSIRAQVNQELFVILQPQKSQNYS